MPRKTVLLYIEKTLTILVSNAYMLLENWLKWFVHNNMPASMIAGVAVSTMRSGAPDNIIHIVVQLLFLLLSMSNSERE